METINVIRQVCILLLNDKKVEAATLAKSRIPFNGNYNVKDITAASIKLLKQNDSPFSVSSINPIIEFSGKKSYQKHINTVLLRDGFIDRYTGQKLVFPGIFFLLHFELPEIIKYDKNWDPPFCHKIFWELYPTVDHIYSQANNGSHEVDNLITTLQVINTHKSKKDFKKLNWKIYPPGDLNKWDGLTSIFFDLMEKRNDYADHTHIENWSTRYNGLRKWKNGMKKALLNNHSY